MGNGVRTDQCCNVVDVLSAQMGGFALCDWPLFGNCRDSSEFSEPWLMNLSQAAGRKVFTIFCVLGNL